MEVDPDSGKVLAIARDIGTGRTPLGNRFPTLATGEGGVWFLQRNSVWKIDPETQDVEFQIPVDDAGESDGVLFLAMRVIRGTDLRRIIDEGGGMDPRRITRLLRHVASALDTAHRAGLVHRDVKPGNILVVADGEDEHAYLADFGLTKQVLSDSGLTRTGQFMGTIDYVAPEQIRGGKVSGLTDEYSLGCVMYEGLTGEAPFHKDQDVAVMFSHLEDARPLVTAKRPDLPPAIDDVIARGMARSPEDRYSTCLAFVSAARAALKLGHADQEHDGSDHEHDAEHANATAPENPPIPPAPSPEPHPSFPPADVPAPELQGVEAVAAVGAPSGGIPTSPTTSAPGAASGDDDRPPSATAVPTGQPVTPSPSPRELDRKAKLVHAAQLVGMALVGAAIATVIFLFTGNGNGSEGEPAAHGASDLRVSDFLLEHLPDEVRQTCTDGANPNPNAFLVTVACTGPDAIEVTYNFAHSRSEMIDHFKEEQAASGIESGSGDCAFVDPGAGPWWRVGSQGHTTIDPEQGTIPEGKVFCHEDASGSSIVWVDRTLGIFASATITPEDRTTLFQWWADDAGPANPETLGHGSGTSGSHEGATGSASGMDRVGSATGPSGSTP